MEKENKEDPKPKQMNTQHMYCLRERRPTNMQESSEPLSLEHLSIEPKPRKIVKKLTIYTAEPSVASIETGTLETKEEHYESLGHTEGNKNSSSRHFSNINDVETHSTEDVCSKIQPENKPSENKSVVVSPASTIENEAKKPFKSNVGFVAVKRSPKIVKPDCCSDILSTQAWIPWLFSPNNQINPFSLINMGLCGIFKFNN